MSNDKKQQKMENKIYNSSVETGVLKVGDKVLFPESFGLPKGSTLEVKSVEYTKSGMIKINGGRALKSTTPFYQ